jgi:hypothetical protein
MRRIRLLLILALCAFPLAAFAVSASAGVTAAGDGSLDVSGQGGSSGANGSVVLSGKGVVFGFVGAGAITVYAYKADSNSVPTVSGAKMTLSNDATSVVYTGSSMRFFFPGGRYKIEIDGTGIAISSVGTGSVTGTGNGTLTTDTTALTLGRAPATVSWGSSAPVIATVVAGGKST